MRKIAIIQRFLPSRSRGGVGHFTHGLANTLVARGHAVTVFSQDPAPADARYSVARVPVADTRFAPLSFPFALRRCDFHGFDVIHAQGDDQWLSHRGLPPIVRTLHGSALAEAWSNGVRAGSPKRFLLHLYFYVMEFIADLRARRVAGVSSGTGRHFPRMHAVVPNGIDVERFRLAGQAATKSAAPSIIFIGELNSRKRGTFLIDVFLRDVRTRVPNAELWLVSPDRPERSDATPANGVCHLGSLSDADLAARLASAWVMCLPSAYEGFGRPYAEAMAAGTVAAATPNPGADDVLDQGRAGVLASDSELGAALSRILTDDSTRASFIRIGRARADLYDWSAVASRYEALYEDALQKMTKILFLHIMSEIGGSDLSLVRLVEGLDKTRYSAIVALPADGPQVAKLKAAGARVEIVPAMLKPTSRKGFGYRIWYILNVPRGVFAIAALIRREHVAIVHTNTIHNLYGVLAAWMAGVPHVWHFREIVWQSGALRRLELWLARHLSARIIVTSEPIAEMYGAKAHWPAHLVRVSNGVEVDRYSPGDGARVRADLNVTPEQTLIGIACRLDPWKGVETFLDAAAIVAAREPNAVFAVVGGPIIGQESYEGVLQQKARDLDIADRVRFTSWRYRPDDMPDVHRALDIFVLASIEPEPFGLVVLEAMATGKPVVATKHGGPLEIIEDGRSGDLVPPGDAAAMADAIIALVKDPQRRARVGQLARARVMAHYTAEQYVAGVEAVYRELAP